MTNEWYRIRHVDRIGVAALGVVASFTVVARKMLFNK